MSLKLKILLFSITAIFLLSGILIGSSVLVNNLVEKRYYASIYNRDNVTWQQVTDYYTNKMKDSVREIARDRDLLKNLKKSQYAAVTEAFTYKYNRMFGEKTLTHAMILDKKNKVIVAQPSRFSFSDAALIDYVVKNKKDKHGFVKAQDGKIYLAYVFPIFYRGSKTVGTGVYMKPLDDLATMSKKYLQADIFVADIKTGKVPHGTSDVHWDKDEILPEEGESKIERINLEGSIYEIAATPIKSFSEQPIAALLTQKDYTESMSHENKFKSGSLLVVVIVILLFVGAFFFFLTRSFAVLIKFSDDMISLAEGNLDVDVDTSRKDEIGEMAKAVQVFKDNAIEARKLREEQERMEREAEREKREAMNNLANEFESEVGCVIDTISSASVEMEATAQAMSSNANQTSGKSGEVASSAQEAAVNVEAAAAAATELTAAIQEISQSVTHSTQVSAEAQQKADATSERVRGLVDAVEKISQVVTLISAIAEQTNLLALNATIEAARAGDAGKGFAVVANEVKSLATQTAEATNEITTQIEELQTTTQESDRAIQDILEVIGRIDEITGSVAAAVEEQGAATSEIARNVREAFQGTENVSNNIGEVTQAAAETGQSATMVLDSAQDLAKQSTALNDSVTNFLARIRSS